MGGCMHTAPCLDYLLGSVPRSGITGARHILSDCFPNGFDGCRCAIARIQYYLVKSCVHFTGETLPYFVYICIFLPFAAFSHFPFPSNCFCFVNCSHPWPIDLFAFSIILFVRILLTFLRRVHINPFKISKHIFPVVFAISLGYVIFF